MKKYLICSDIHGREDILRFVVQKEKPLDGVIVAGDLQLEAHEIENIIRKEIPRFDLYMVCGNCDRYTFTAAQLPPFLAFDLSGHHKVLLTHGHLFPGRAPHSVMGMTALQKHCDILIYGHTHRAVDTTENGIRFINGGALMRGEYAILTLNDDESIEVRFKPE